MSKRNSIVAAVAVGLVAALSSQDASAARYDVSDLWRGWDDQYSFAGLNLEITEPGQYLMSFSSPATLVASPEPYSCGLGMPCYGGIGVTQFMTVHDAYQGFVINVENSWSTIFTPVPTGVRAWIGGPFTLDQDAFDIPIGPDLTRTTTFHHYIDFTLFAGPEAGGQPWRFTVASVPEPTAWGLMIAGFGLTGAVLRRRRRVLGASLAR